MHRHEWHENTEDGDIRFVRATFHGGRWTWEETLKSEDEWHRLDGLELRDLESLRELMWNKYQRKRVTHGHVKYIDKLIADAKEKENG